MNRIVIIPISLKDHNLPEYLAMVLQETFNLPCSVRKNDIEIETEFCPDRKQYHSTQILKKILESSPDPQEKKLGIVDVDLFIPILTFVFGEAQLNGPASLISTHRLHQSYYALPPNNTTFYHRAEKEAVHELGHTFGLIHCSDYECVMHYANTVDDIDLKNSQFCKNCLAGIAS